MNWIQTNVGAHTHPFYLRFKIYIINPVGTSLSLNSYKFRSCFHMGENENRSIIHVDFEF